MQGNMGMWYADTTLPNRIFDATAIQFPKGMTRKQYARWYWRWVKHFPSNPLTEDTDGGDLSSTYSSRGNE